MSGIKAGYQLHVTTWENDADNYATNICSGLSEEDTRFYIAWIKQFKSRNGWREKGLGNGSNTEQNIIDSFKTALEVCKPTSPEMVEIVDEYLKAIESDFDTAASNIYDWLCDEVLNRPMDEYYASELFFTRVVESYKVFYIPTDIENVTAQFKN